MVAKKVKRVILFLLISIIATIISAYFVLYAPKVHVYAINDSSCPLNVSIKLDKKVVMNSQVNGWWMGVSGHKSVTTNLHIGKHEIQVFTINMSHQKMGYVEVYHDCNILVYLRLGGVVEIITTNEDPHFK